MSYSFTWRGSHESVKGTNLNNLSQSIGEAKASGASGSCVESYSWMAARTTRTLLFLICLSDFWELWGGLPVSQLFRSSSTKAFTPVGRRFAT